MAYQVPHNIEHNKVFLVNFSELDGRLEPEYYRPSLYSLEKKIRSLSSKKLCDYAISIAGGATPAKTEYDKYYSESKSGIPFLRVQNLQTNGELSLDDCVYINEETHDGLLKRSQVAEGDLLVKITGVGRMAVASVAPKGFIGNTNQHMVVIKTGDAELSKYLAHYLNLDIIERIASRHSTGGTRPALDYPSLKSIPIIEGIDFTPINNAIEVKKEKEAEAKKILDGMDLFLSEELGLTLNNLYDVNNNFMLENRLFYTNFSEVCGGRLDSNYYSKKYKDILNVIKCKNYKKLSSLVSFSSECWDRKSIYDTKIPYIEIGAINTERPEIDYVEMIAVEEAPSRAKYIVRTNDIIVSTTRPSRGAIVKIGKEHNLCIASSGFAVIRNIDNNLDINYLLYILRHKISLLQFEQKCTGGNYPAITQEDLGSIIIPLPPLTKQQEVSCHITEMYKKVKALQEEGKNILEQAKREVERMIIGK